MHNRWTISIGIFMFHSNDMLESKTTLRGGRSSYFRNYIYTRKQWMKDQYYEENMRVLL